jgi:hypothetical protein
MPRAKEHAAYRRGGRNADADQLGRCGTNTASVLTLIVVLTPAVLAKAGTAPPQSHSVKLSHSVKRKILIMTSLRITVSQIIFA